MTRWRCRLSVVLVAFVSSACGAGTGSPSPPAPTPPTSSTATVRIVYLASTTVRNDLPPAAALCARAEAPTHLHVGWRNYQTVMMTADGSDRWEAVLTDVPVNVRQLIALSDPNACVENDTGSVTRDVFANDVRLTDVQTIPNLQPTAPGLAFTVTASGHVSP
jgi:hypothetical protein